MAGPVLTQAGLPVKPWWSVDEKELVKYLFPLAEVLRKNSQIREQDQLRWFRLYGNYNAQGLTVGTYTRPAKAKLNRLTRNVIYSVIDTIVSKIASEKPKPTFLTSGGSWSQRKRAKMLDKFCQGQFYRLHIYDLLAEGFRDACVFGNGATKIFIRDGEICAERTFPGELLIDDMEAVYGNPRQLHQRRPVSREIMLARAEEMDLAGPAMDAIRKASRCKPESVNEQYSDMIWVIEAWHLPSGDGAKDGRHAMVIENFTLDAADWKRDCFPFVFQAWNKPLRGFWAQGIAEQLVGTQYSVNRRLQQLDESAEWTVPKAWIHASTKIAKSALNADVGGIMEWDGPLDALAVPTIKAVNAMPQELYQHLDKLEASAYTTIGVSQMSAQSKKPAGLESGEAIREYLDIESARFKMAVGNYVQASMTMAEHLIDNARIIGKSNKNYAVTVLGRKYTIPVKWSEVEMEKDQYVIQVFPTSALPQSPSGRLETITDLNQLGLVDREQMIRLLDFPDLEAMNELAEADADLVDNQIEQMIEHGRVQKVQAAFQDLAYAIKTATATYKRILLMEDVPDKNKTLLREYILDATALLAKSQQPPQPAGPTPSIPAGATVQPQAPMMNGGAAAPPQM